MPEPIYNPRTVIPELVPQAIAAGYAAAGIDRPTPAAELITAAVRELPEAATVGRTIVAESHDTTLSPAKFVTDAHRRMTEALAGDALREAFSRHGRNVLTARISEACDQAAEDCAPAFGAAVESLRGAA
ncbi:hypothetical protein, partial [Kocuria flava]|uniref:hypothetical protein n=1 Tax=Kocuria flava TaxID=446860 RepID=UPI0011BDEF67